MPHTPKAPLHIVITGASSGIGAATAIAFARQGARLVLAARGEAGLADIVDRCNQVGGKTIYKIVDVTHAAAVAALASEACDHLGVIDLWFSDVGVGVVGRYGDVPIEAHRQIIEANLIGHMNDAHAVLPIFLRQGYGIWVNMISVGAFVATPYAAAYAASKFGLRGFSQALRGEVSKHPRIHICDVYPTFVDTPGLDHAGNYTGGRLSVPPGVLSPSTVADAVVRLADRPRNTAVIGAPAIGMKLAQFLTPNIGAAAMNAFMDRYFAKAERVFETDGALHVAPAHPSGIDGGLRRPEQRRVAAWAAGGATAVALAGVVALLWRRRR